MVATLYRLSIGHAHYYMGGSNILPEPEYGYEPIDPSIDPDYYDHERAFAALEAGYVPVKPMARFSGSAADYLGIEGERVTEDDQRVRNFFQGMSPDGQYQLRKMQDRERTNHLTGEKEVLRARPAYDHVLNAPKSVSVAYALGTENERATILFCHQQAVTKVEEYLSERAMTRTGAGGKNQEKVESLYLTVDHDTNRAVEPHLHSHIAQFNFGRRENGKWGALDANHMFHDHHHVGGLYLGVLRDGLEERGLPTRTVELKHGQSFELEQVEQRLMDEFSTPSRVAREHLKEKNIEQTGKAMHIAVLDTHDAKRPIVDKAKVVQGWKDRAESHGGYHPEVVLERKSQNNELEEYIPRSYVLEAEQTEQKLAEQQSEVKRNAVEEQKREQHQKVERKADQEKQQKQEQEKTFAHRTGQQEKELNQKTGQLADRPVARTGQDVPEPKRGVRGYLVDATPTRYTVEFDEGSKFRLTAAYRAVKEEFKPQVKVERVDGSVRQKKSLPDLVMTQENIDRKKGEQRAAEAEADHRAGKFNARQSMPDEATAGERLVRKTTVGNYVADKYLKYKYGTPQASVTTTNTLASKAGIADGEKTIVKMEGSEVLRAVDKAKIQRMVSPGESSRQKYTPVKAQRI